MLFEKNILAPNFAAGAAAAFLDGGNKNIFVDNGGVVYKKIFFPSSSGFGQNTKLIWAGEVETLPEKYSKITNQKDENNDERIYCRDFNELLEICKNYKKISCEANFIRLLSRHLRYGYINESEFSTSLEGRAWILAKKIINSPLESIDFNLETAFPYIKYSPFEKQENFAQLQNLAENVKSGRIELRALVEKILGRPTIFENNGDGINIAHIIELNVKKNMIFPIEASYFGDIDISIGKNFNPAAKINLIYEPSLQHNIPFQEKKINHYFGKYQTNLKTIKLLNKGYFSELIATIYGLKMKQKNIYSQVRQHVLSEIFATLKGKEPDTRWKTWLIKSGVKYMKILQKAQNMIDDFEICFKKENFASFEIKIFQDINEICVPIDFLGQTTQKEFVIIDFLWSAPTDISIFSAQEAKYTFLKMYFKEKLKKILIITTDGVKAIDPSKLPENIKTNKTIQLREEKFSNQNKFQDLFYWESIKADDFPPYATDPEPQEK